MLEQFNLSYKNWVYILGATSSGRNVRVKIIPHYFDPNMDFITNWGQNNEGSLLSPHYFDPNMDPILQIIRYLIISYDNEVEQ